MSDTTTPHPDTPQGKPGRYWLWPGIVVGILLTHTVCCLVVVYIATSDPTHAVIPDYHEKAVAWDAIRADALASEQLGWACTIETAAGADLLGERSLRLSLKDARGEPVSGATVSLEGYHHARANDTVLADLKEGAPGEYVAMLKMRKPGLWRFDVKAKWGEDVFVQQIDQPVGERG